MLRWWVCGNGKKNKVDVYFPVAATALATSAHLDATLHKRHAFRLYLVYPFVDAVF
jgi:hypothetical protein